MSRMDVVRVTCDVCGRNLDVRPDEVDLTCYTVPVTVETDEMPALEVPYPEPLQDVSKIVYNGFTTRGVDCTRIFVPMTTCYPTSKPPVPKHQTGCSNCGCTWDWFYVMGGFNGPPNYCPRCGAKVTKEK